jgi:hypothetical protein
MKHFIKVKNKYNTLGKKCPKVATAKLAFYSVINGYSENQSFSENERNTSLFGQATGCF